MFSKNRVYSRCGIIIPSTGRKNIRLSSMIYPYEPTITIPLYNLPPTAISTRFISSFKNKTLCMRTPMATRQIISFRHFRSSQPSFKQDYRPFSTTPSLPPISTPSLTPATPSMPHTTPSPPKLFVPSQEFYDHLTAQAWRIVKILAVLYCGGSLAILYGSRIFFSVLQGDIESKGITDLQTNGSLSPFYLPLLHQDRSFAAQFDPNYPSLNHYNLRIFTMKEMEAAVLAAEGVYENSRTIIFNSSLRVNLLERIIKQGWASQYELSMVYRDDKVTSRSLNDLETMALSDNASRVREEYESMLADQSLSEEDKLKIRNDPQYQAVDRIELSKQQLIYLQQGLDEFNRLNKVGYKLQELSVQLRASSTLALWRMVRFSGSVWDIPFDHMTPAYHHIATTAAAAAKLNDAIYSLTSTNLQQILSFMRNFDKTIQLINNPEQIKKNKFALPLFPKLAFDVLSSAEYTAQLATIRNQIRSIHDPMYDPINPLTTTLAPSDPVTNTVITVSSIPELSNQSSHLSGNRDFIPYVSPSRPNNVPQDKDLIFLREKYVIDPPFEKELEYSQTLLKAMRNKSNDFVGLLAGLKASWGKSKIKNQQDADHDATIKARIEKAAL